MRHSTLHTAGNVVWVARHEGREAVPLLLTYTRLKAKELMASRRASGTVSRARILDLDVAFFDYFWMVEMFEEIFMRKQYHFPSENERPVILDVGSNIGLSILYFKKLFREATIIGFEPDPDTFAVLSRNMAANGLDDVVLRNEAVHDRNDRVDLYGDPERPGSPRQSTSAGRISAATRSVRATRLSDHMLQPIDFLKLDVEGAELTVVDELDRSGKLPLVERMAIEYHHHLDEEEDLFSQLLATLERAGFGYQLEARIGSVPRPREYQNILVRAYRKDHPVRPLHRG